MTWGLLENHRSNTRAKLLRFGLLELSCVLTALANPYSYRLFVYFFVTNSETTKKYVAEWQPAQFKDVILLLCLSVMFLALLRKKRLNFSLFLPVLLCVAMTAYRVRIRTYALIVLIPFALDCIRQTPDATPKPLKATFSKRCGALYLALTLCAVAATGLSTRNFVHNERLIADTVSEDIWQTLEHLAQERLYTPYDVGGIAIYHGFSSFIDSRADPFPDAVLEEAMSFERCRPIYQNGMALFLNRYQFDAALLNVSYPGVLEFLWQNGWTTIAGDERWMLMVPPNNTL